MKTLKNLLLLGGLTLGAAKILSGKKSKALPKKKVSPAKAVKKSIKKSKPSRKRSVARYN